MQSYTRSRSTRPAQIRAGERRESIEAAYCGRCGWWNSSGIRWIECYGCCQPPSDSDSLRCHPAYGLWCWYRAEPSATLPVDGLREHCLSAGLGGSAQVVGSAWLSGDSVIVDVRMYEITARSAVNALNLAPGLGRRLGWLLLTGRYNYQPRVPYVSPRALLQPTLIVTLVFPPAAPAAFNARQPTAAMSASELSTVAVFKEIFGELSKFSQSVYKHLEKHERGTMLRQHNATTHTAQHCHPPPADRC